MNTPSRTPRFSPSLRIRSLVFLFLVLVFLGMFASLCGCSPNSAATTNSDEPNFAGSVSDESGSASSNGESGAKDAEEGAEKPSDSLAQQAEALVASMSLEQKVAQLFVVRPESITGMGVVTQAGEATRAALEKYPVGGLAYFSNNLIDGPQTKLLLSNTQTYYREITGLPAFLCVDEEGGTVARIAGNPEFAVENVGDMRDVGATGDTNYARSVAANIGGYLRDYGFNVDFAPDADIANNPDSTTMAQRVFGTTAEEVSPMVKAQVEGFLSAGVLCAAKHFPGIGGAEGDSHNESIYSEKTADQMAEDEFLPFQAAMEAQVPFIMIGHLSAPNITGSDLPATVSREIVTGLLRDRLGYQGIIITDSLEMGAVTERHTQEEIAVAVLEAGVDMVLLPVDFPAAYQGVLDAVASGRLSEDRIDSSVERIVRTKLAWESGV